MHVSYSWFTKIAILLYVVYFYYNQLIVAVFGYSFSIELLLVALVLSVIGNHVFYKKNKVFWLLWGILLVVYLVNNRALAHGLYPLFTTYLIYFVGGLVLTNSRLKEAVFVVRCLAFIGLANCIATVLFFLIPSLYSGIPSLLKTTPVWGIGAGIAYGYRAGLTTHYSSNGIYCAVELISLFTVLTKGKGSTRRFRKVLLFFTVLSAFALLLTAKRGVLVFSIVSIIAMWYVCSRDGQVTRFVKALFYSAVVLCSILILAQFIPAIANTVSRFTDSTDISSGRFMIWARAIEGFKDHPLLGNGWFGFFYDVLNQNTYFGASNAHNIYLQLLCETGVVGFTCVVSFFIVHLIFTIKICRRVMKCTNPEIRLLAVISITIQIFCLIYGFTGNILYDFTFISYMLACAIVPVVKNSCQYKEEQQ